MLKYKIKDLSTYHKVQISKENVEFILDILYRKNFNVLPWDVINYIDYAMGVARNHNLASVDISCIMENMRANIDSFLEMPKERTLILAYHEVGHCILGKVFNVKFHGIQIIPSESSLGCNFFMLENIGTMSKTECFNQICIALGGALLTELKGYERIDGASNDLAQASSYARNMVVNYGMEDDDLMSYVETGVIVVPYMSENIKESVDSKARTVLKAAIKKASEILKENEENIEILVSALIKKGLLTAKEVSDLLEDTSTGKKLSIDDIPDIRELLFD